MLNDFYNKIIAIQEFDIVSETMAIIDKNHKFLSDLLISQLSKGKDSLNQNVTVLGKDGVKRDFYSDRTIFEKQFHGSGLGRVTDYITNYMSGNFYREMFLKIAGTDFNIESRVPYFQEVLKRSGDVIMELSTENLKIFQEDILIPQLQEAFTKRFNGV